MNPISFSQAFEIVKISHPEEKFDSCIEYTDLYVFSNNNKRIGSGLYAVSKSDGHCFSFKPFFISLNEYRSGKKVM